MLNFTFTLSRGASKFLNFSSCRPETAVTADPPPTAHRPPLTARKPHAPIAACTAARLHASRPHALTPSRSHAGTIATQNRCLQSPLLQESGLEHFHSSCRQQCSTPAASSPQASNSSLQ
nr:hypothetical protein Iba_chr06bCG15230 [Ipomoea batatas]